MAYIEWWNRTGPITMGERFGLNEISTARKTLSPTNSHTAGLLESFPGTFTSYNDAVSNGFQGTREEWLQQQSIPQIDRPLTGAAGGRVDMKPGGIVEPGVTHYAVLTETEKAANVKTWEKNTGLKFKNITNSNIANKIKRGETTGAGKGEPGKVKTLEHKAKIKETHWSKKKDIKHITHSPERIKMWDKQTALKRAILEEVKKGISDSKQIAKNLKVSHTKLIQESEELFKHIYEQQMKVNTNIKRTGLLTRMDIIGDSVATDRAALKTLLTDLRAVNGFAPAEAETWYTLIRDARTSGRITIDQFKTANKNVKQFFDLAHKIKTKYPSIVLNLDHTLSRGMLTLFNAQGEKFLTGMPSTETFNKGIKEKLDIKYKNIVDNLRKGVPGAAEQKIALEKLVKNLNIDLGEISKTGKKIISVGKESIVLGKAPIEQSIIQALEKQSSLVEKIKNINPKLLVSAGMDKYFKKSNLPKITSGQLENIKKLLKSEIKKDGGKLFMKIISPAFWGWIGDISLAEMAHGKPSGETLFDVVALGGAWRKGKKRLISSKEENQAYDRNRILTMYENAKDGSSGMRSNLMSMVVGAAKNDPDFKGQPGEYIEWLKFKVREPNQMTLALEREQKTEERLQVTEEQKAAAERRYKAWSLFTPVRTVKEMFKMATQSDEEKEKEKTETLESLLNV